MGKFEKNVNCTMSKELYLKISEICKEREIPISLFIRETLKSRVRDISMRFQDEWIEENMRKK
jgi:hypothetical protein